MTTQVAMLLAILAAMSISFFTELLPISFTALMVPVLLQATGILKPAEAWAGFSNTTIITWYGLFVIGGAFTKTSFTKKIRDFVNRNAKGSSLRVTLIVLLACSVIGIMTSAGGTIALLSPLLLEICKDTGMDPKKLFKPTADVCNWASVQMLPVGGSIAYLMWFNSYLEQVGTDLRYGLFDFTFIKFPMWLILVAYYLFMSRGQKLKDASIAAVAEDDKPSRYTPEQEKVIVGIFFLNVILMVIASMTKIIAPYLVSLFFAAIIVGRGYLTEKEAFQSISWQTVFLVAGTLPLATAINSSGMSDWIVSLVQAAFPSMTNPVVLATAFAVLSMVVTQFMSNLAVWAVFGPIAASMAVSLGMDPRLVLAGVSVGSIICFATPMAAPAPAYAYSAAGFTMKEYIKMGWFPCVLMTIVFVLWAPLVLNWLY